MATNLPPRMFDETDWRILRELQDHGRIPNVELADRVGLSPAPCLRRLRFLERAGIIRKYVTLIDAKTVGLGVTVFVQIRLDLQVKGRFEIFEQAVLQRSEVLECYLMTGDADFLLRVVVPDVEAYERFLRDWLSCVESVSGIKSSFALKQVKYSTVLPLDSGRPFEGASTGQLKHARSSAPPRRSPARKKRSAAGRRAGA